MYLHNVYIFTEIFFEFVVRPVTSGLRSPTSKNPD